MKKLKYGWFSGDWGRLDAGRARLPHALLIQGAADIGKRALAEHLAQSLLCEKPAAQGHPCGECQACHWFADGNHPDFRAVLPEILQPAVEGQEETDVEAAAGGARSTKAPSREIKIEQIRRLDSFFNIGTHRGGARVVLVYPADAMNVPAGNALLKTLEEPAPGTVFLLVTGHPDRVLPTIRSRAARFVVAAPPTEACLAWLREQGVARPEQLLAEAGGAPLAALRAAAEDEAHRAERETLLDALGSTGGQFDPLALAEKCEKAGNENIALWLMRWVSDLARVGQTGGNPRYHPAHAPALAARAGALDAREVHRFYRRLTEARRIAAHPLNSRLFIEELLIDYARLAQPAGRTDS